MPTDGKPTIIIGCGAHHIAHHYRFLTANLEKSGYVVRVVQLASTSDKVIEDAMTKDVDVIRSAVEDEIAKEKDVVMLLHSWSGFVGCAALQNLEKHVKHVVFLAAWIQPSGVGSCAWLGLEELSIYDVKDGLNFVKQPREVFYNDLTNDLDEDSIQHLLPMVNSVTKLPLVYEPLWEKVQCTYVICEEDRAVPEAFAEKMMKESGFEGRGRVVRIRGGHSPFLGGQVGEFPFERELGGVGADVMCRDSGGDSEEGCWGGCCG